MAGFAFALYASGAAPQVEGPVPWQSCGRKHFLHRHERLGARKPAGPVSSSVFAEVCRGNAIFGRYSQNWDLEVQSLKKMRVAATADLHFTPQRFSTLHDQLNRVRDDADVFVLAGDLTNYGRPDEMEPLLNVLVRLRLPVIAVLGNHDYESGKEAELIRMLTQEGVKVLDGSAYERDGVGFAGTKGVVGGFGRGVLTAFGEPEIKNFVRASIDEAMKLERAMSQLRTKKRVVVLHYSPVAATVVGESPEIYPYLSTSRLGEVVDRHGANLVVHGHAHHGSLCGKTTAGIPVHNVAITLLQGQQPGSVYRIFDI